MGFVVVIDLDLALGVLKPANVDSSSTCILLQDVHEVGQVVSQVLRCFELLKEALLVFLFCLGSLNFLLLATLIKGQSLNMLSFLIRDC